MKSIKITKKMIPTLVLIGTILLGLIGITYAYFSIQVRGNEDASSMTVTTASLRLKYTDGPEIRLEKVFPGTSVEKEVKVENIGTVGVTYALGFMDMTNTFVNDELLISYTCKSYVNYGTENQRESGNCYPLEERVLTSDPGIEEGIFIGVGITQVYNIKLEFIETGELQNSNMGATFRGILNIGESVNAFTLVAQVLLENDDLCIGCIAEIQPSGRTAVTDEYGIFTMPKIAQGIHEIIIKDGTTGVEIMRGGIEIKAASILAASEMSITGQIGTEEVAVSIKRG